MKCNIAVIDRDILNKAIAVHEATLAFGEEKAYLFMNEDTLKILVNDALPDDAYPKFNLSRWICNYRGHNVYLNNDLPFGEIQIR